jgi:hypothetical protein
MAENAVKGEMNQSKDVDKDGARSKQMSDRELTVREIIEDLQAIEQELHAYERKCRLASVVFYELYCQGKLDDDGYELTEDLGMWAGAYEIKLDRERRFLELSREYQLHPSQLAFRDPRDRANRSRRKTVKAAV